MRKKTKALSGASQDAYFRRVLKAHPDLSAEERDRLVHRFRHDIAQLRVRVAQRAQVETPAPRVPESPAEIEALTPSPPTPPVKSPPSPFDPFSPNVVVVIRTSGREAALAALGAIENPDGLRLLAREQRLTIPTGVLSAADLRAAIVTAAERRIANRVAAAG
jgi:hypothetical protein